MVRQHIFLDINEVELDKDNPRIRGALEKYGDKLTPERLHFALKTSGDDATSATSGFYKLQQSIKNYGGIEDAIKVIEKDGKKICIDGNTRLAIYREFQKTDVPGNWDTISSILIDNASVADVEKIRITAHLVGARAWHAYDKAKYLAELYIDKAMSIEDIIDLCGSSDKDIRIQIEAFHEMNDHYRKRLENEGDFDHTRFSGFVELQKHGIKDAIFSAGFGLDDFGDWIKNHQIRRLEYVRKLPKVLSDKDAKQAFITGGANSISNALQIVNDKYKSEDPDTAKLSNATLSSLVHTLNKKISTLPFNEVMELKENSKLLDDLDELSTNIGLVIKAAGADVRE